MANNVRFVDSLKVGAYQTDGSGGGGGSLTINNNVANLNRSNEIVANMFYSMDRAYNNQPNDMVYFSVNNNRRRRLNMPSRTLSPVSNIPEQELPVPSIEQEQPIPSIEQEQPVLSIEPIPPSNNDGYRQLSINNLTTVINDNIRKYEKT